MIKHSPTPWAATLLTLLLPLGGCMTTGGTHGPRGLTDPSAATTEKAGSKDATAGAGNGATAAATPGQAPGAPQARRIETPPPPSVDDQLAFVRRATPADAPFNEGDRQFVQALPGNPAPGSVAEAALALGLVKTVLHPLGGEATTFEEQDLSKPAAPAGTAGAEAGKDKATSLEQLCRQHGVNLPDALSENPLLGTAGMAKQTEQALAVGDNGAEFRTEVTSALRKQAVAWNEVSSTMPAGPQPSTGADVTPPPPPGAMGSPQGAAGVNGQGLAGQAGGPGGPGLGDRAAAGQGAAGAAGQGAGAAAPGTAAAGATGQGMAGAGAAGAAVAAAGAAGLTGAATPPPAGPVAAPGTGPNATATLTEAQQIADRGDYPEAIKRLQSVPADSPQKPAAQEKVKEYSNLGVQELRKKAALAFQTAMPVSDPRTRAGYLKQAKTYLEEAVTKYPDAPQLTTVKDNLRVISHDLESLEAEASNGRHAGE